KILEGDNKGNRLFNVPKHAGPVRYCTRTLHDIFSQADHPLLLCKRAIAMTIADFYVYARFK
ncbi:MAG: hypothetical protein KF888_12710, partial [Nitrosomonas sp.]|nr:hypothetical protein [Nitrosomonas sp.]